LGFIKKFGETASEWCNNELTIILPYPKISAGCGPGDLVIIIAGLDCIGVTHYPVGVATSGI